MPNKGEMERKSSTWSLFMGDIPHGMLRKDASSNDVEKAHQRPLLHGEHKPLVDKRGSMVGYSSGEGVGGYEDEDERGDAFRLLEDEFTKEDERSLSSEWKGGFRGKSSGRGGGGWNSPGLTSGGSSPNRSPVVRASISGQGLEIDSLKDSQATRGFKSKMRERLTIERWGRLITAAIKVTKLTSGRFLFVAKCKGCVKEYVKRLEKCLGEEDLFDRQYKCKLCGKEFLQKVDPKPETLKPEL
jgi:hypothetical protein